MKIILASKSPRRKELLTLMGLDYDVIVSDVDESFEKGLSLEEQSKRLAYIKAKAVFERTKGNRIIIGSDTMVIKNGNLYGKPKDKNDAINMLNNLKNTFHEVITSLCVLVEKNGEYKEYLTYDTAKVYFKNMTEKEIYRWIESGNPYDKAGGYAIQSAFGVFVDKIEGNYFTVVGLPIHKLYDILKEIKDVIQ